MAEVPPDGEEQGTESPWSEAQDQGYQGGPDAASGDEDASIEGQFELHLRGVVPKSGPTDGGTVLTVDGTGLANVTSVQLGGVEATFEIAGGGDALTVTTPGGAEGDSVDLVVATDDDSTDLGDAFTYTDDDDEDGS